VPCGDNGSPPYLGLSRELWTRRRSVTSRRWSGTQACHKHHGNQRDGSSGQNIGWKRYVKDKWVNQESRTLDTECRDPARRAQRGNNESRRPYIRPQSAGSWISRSRGVQTFSLSTKWTVSQASNRRGSHNQASRRKQRRGKHTRSKITTSRRSGLGHQESPIWDTSGWVPEGITRLSQGVCFPTLSWPHPGESPLSLVCQRQTDAAYDEEPSAWGGKSSETQRTLPNQAGPGVTDERWIDMLLIGHEGICHLVEGVNRARRDILPRGEGGIKRESVAVFRLAAQVG